MVEEVEALINCPNCGKSFMILNKKYEQAVISMRATTTESTKDPIAEKVDLQSQKVENQQKLNFSTQLL